MSKKKKSRNPSSPNKTVIAVIASFAFGLFLVFALVRYLNDSEYFKVKTILIDPALQYINRDDLSRYKNVNIFTIDPPSVRKRLSSKYPQITDLKVIKKYPDQLMLVAKKRLPFVQAKVRGQTVTFDDDGVVLSRSSEENKKIALIRGIAEGASIELGSICKDGALLRALEVLKAFKNVETLKAYDIVAVDAAHLSKIELTLENKLIVYVDQTFLLQKMRTLAMILSQGQINLEETNYIDLRFKEPIIGKKENVKQNNKR